MVHQIGQCWGQAVIVLGCDDYECISILDDFHSVLQYLGGFSYLFVEVDWLLEQRNIKDIRICKCRLKDKQDNYDTIDSKNCINLSAGRGRGDGLERDFIHGSDALQLSLSCIYAQTETKHWVTHIHQERSACLTRANSRY